MALKNEQPDTKLVFFIDRCLGKHIIPDALRRAGCNVICHDEVFDPDEKDTVWLNAAGSKGWIVITRDKKIVSRKNELIEVISGSVVVFILVSKKPLTGNQMAKILLKSIPKIKKYHRKIIEKELGDPPYIFKISSNGNVKRWK